MSESNDGTIHSAGDGAVSGSHPKADPLRILVGATTESQANAVQAGLLPIACFKLEDVRFDFDSSVLLPNTANEMPVLKALIDMHLKPAATEGGKATRPPASIFGHTDPEGPDDYNKTLGGRRAAVLYGLLTRRTEIWEDMYSDTNKFTSVNSGGKWGVRSLQIMLNAMPPDPSVQPPPDPLDMDGKIGPKTQDAIKRFQSAHGLSPSGSADQPTRKALFQAYMDILCVDSDGKPWQLDPKDDFLGHNADPGGKADFQGCGEFNPVMLFSKSDLQAYDSASDHTERDEKNRQNRRVMVLLFRPGTTVNTKKWPCPLAKEGLSGCPDRFWSDGDKRRSNGPMQREYEKTKDTFACRFYQRLLCGSPCEIAVGLIHISNIIFLNYPAGPLKNEKYKLFINSSVVCGNTGNDGHVHRENVPPGDYRLEIADRVTYVSAIPLAVERLPWLLDIDSANGAESEVANGAN